MRVVLASDIHVATLTLPVGRADVCPRGSAQGRYLTLLSEPTLGKMARRSNAAATPRPCATRPFTIEMAENGRFSASKAAGFRTILVITFAVNSEAHYPAVIRSFKNKETEAVFQGEHVKGLDGRIQQRAREKLRYLDSADDLRDLMVPPSNQLEALKGTRKGQYSIRINRQWRVCFTWKDGDASDVEIVDYH